MQKRNFPPKKITFNPEALKAIDAYAKERGLRRSPAVCELILYVILGEDRCPINPKVLKGIVEKVRKDFQ